MRITHRRLISIIAVDGFQTLFSYGQLQHVNRSKFIHECQQHKNYGDELLIQIKMIGCEFCIREYAIVARNLVQVLRFPSSIWWNLEKKNYVLKILKFFFLISHQSCHTYEQFVDDEKKWVAGGGTNNVDMSIEMERKSNKKTTASIAIQTLTGRMQWTHVKIMNQENKSHFFTSFVDLF